MTTPSPGQASDSVVSSIQSAENSEPSLQALAERREFPRIPFRGRAKAIIFPPPTCPANTTLHDSDVVTSDLSRGGVSILCRKELEPGQHLMLMLNGKTHLIQVCWCSSIWEGLFAAGCRFQFEPHDLDVDAQLTAIDVVIGSEANWWEDDEVG